MPLRTRHAQIRLFRVDRYVLDSFVRHELLRFKEEEAEAIVKALEAEIVIVIMKSAPALCGVSVNSAAAVLRDSWITAPETFSWRANGAIATSATGCFGR